jgi:adenylate cyclase class 2
MSSPGLLGYGEADLTGENTVSVYARHGIDLLRLDRVSLDRSSSA